MSTTELFNLAFCISSKFKFPDMPCEKDGMVQCMGYPCGLIAASWACDMLMAL